MPPKNTNKQSTSAPTDSPTTTQTSQAQPSSTTARQDMVDSRRASGAFVNLREIPAAPGEWAWLQPADAERARALGINTPIEATIARSERRLGDGLDTPVVVFRPDTRYYNPSQQPQGPGRWEYFSSQDAGSAREYAWTQFGGQAQYGFENVPYPTARQIRDLRARMTAAGRSVDILDDATLVWVPRNTAPTDPEINPIIPTSPRPVDPEVFDPAPPHHRHDLTNGGENDQTGAADLHWYRTIDLDGKKYTCDVSTAVIKRPQPHKLWIPNDKGEWKQWKHAGTLDWSNKDDLKALNSWRDQKLSRGKWPAKRKDKRDDYHEDEKRWVFEIIVKNGGKPPGSEALAGITVDFNKLFNAKRTQAAISGLCARLAKMYKDHDGKFFVGPKRGAAKKAEKERKQQERDESEASEKKGAGKRKRDDEDGDDESRKRIREEDGDDQEDDTEMGGAESGDEGTGGEEGDSDDEFDVASDAE